MTHLDAALAALDAGLQTSTEAGANVGTGCWRCSTQAHLSDIGLCPNCNDWLHSDDCFLPLPHNATLHPPVHDIPGS